MLWNLRLLQLVVFSYFIGACLPLAAHSWHQLLLHNVRYSVTAFNQKRSSDIGQAAVLIKRYRLGYDVWILVQLLCILLLYSVTIGQRNWRNVLVLSLNVFFSFLLSGDHLPEEHCKCTKQLFFSSHLPFTLYSAIAHTSHILCGAENMFFIFYNV